MEVIYYQIKAKDKSLKKKKELITRNSWARLSSMNIYKASVRHNAVCISELPFH